MRLDEDQIGGLELAMNKAEDPQKGVSRWLEEKEHRELVRPGSEPQRTRRRSSDEQRAEHGRYQG